MIYLLSLSIFLLIVLIVVITFQNQKIKKNHLHNIIYLNGLIEKLSTKHQTLYNKIGLDESFKINHKKYIINIGNEIVELQKMFVKILNTKSKP